MPRARRSYHEQSHRRHNKDPRGCKQAIRIRRVPATYQDVAATGLKAEPTDPTLLYYSAVSAAFLRQGATASDLIRRYLAEANAACMSKEYTERILDLSHIMNARVSPKDQQGGLPHWISGARYLSDQTFYDPVSLVVRQPISRVVSPDGLSTIFERDDRSVLVKSIATTRNISKQPDGSSTTVFSVKPRYDRRTSTMVEIGSKANSAGERASHPLTYLTTPTIDVELVTRVHGTSDRPGLGGESILSSSHLDRALSVRSHLRSVRAGVGSDSCARGDRPAFGSLQRAAAVHLGGRFLPVDPGQGHEVGLSARDALRQRGTAEIRNDHIPQESWSHRVPTMLLTAGISAARNPRTISTTSGSAWGASIRASPSPASA